MLLSALAVVVSYTCMIRAHFFTKFLFRELALGEVAMTLRSISEINTNHTWSDLVPRVRAGDLLVENWLRTICMCIAHLSNLCPLLLFSASLTVLLLSYAAIIIFRSMHA